VIPGRGDPLLPLAFRDPLLPRRLDLDLLSGSLVLRPLNRREHHRPVTPRLALLLLALLLLAGGALGIEQDLRVPPADLVAAERVRHRPSPPFDGSPMVPGSCGGAPCQSRPSC
jgi:hypothetical protein